MDSKIGFPAACFCGRSGCRTAAQKNHQSSYGGIAYRYSSQPFGTRTGKTAGIKGKQFANEISNTELREVIACVKGLEIDLTEPLGMDSAQVTAGGVLTDGFEPDSMESKLVPGLYACGEVLDIDGDCGGYNLQWAWSSGRMAGLHAGKDI